MTNKQFPQATMAMKHYQVAGINTYPLPLKFLYFLKNISIKTIPSSSCSPCLVLSEQPAGSCSRFLYKSLWDLGHDRKHAGRLVSRVFCEGQGGKITSSAIIALGISERCPWKWYLCKCTLPIDPVDGCVVVS